MPIRDPELTPESIRAAMAIPSTDRMRGLKDGVGFATTPEAMAAVVAASSGEPAHPLGPVPDAPWIGAICPHDDLRYAGRVYRRALAGITAKTVVVIGTFHGWQKFRSGLGLFDTRESWFAPDGPVRVSALREAVRTRMGPFARPYPLDDAAFDLEHSIEPIVAWLRHERPDVEILPLLPPASPSIDDVVMSAGIVGSALADEMGVRGLKLGKDVAVVISADAIHYGADFGETRYGEGHATYELVLAEELRIMRTLLAGRVDPAIAMKLFDTFVDREAENLYRWTWCGRFAIPFGISFLAAMTGGAVTAWPLAYETSVSAPVLDVPQLGFTAPATYEHFVGYPAVAFTFAQRAAG